MHVQYGHTAVNNIHVIVCKNIGDCSAATLIYLSKFCCLERYIVFIHNIAKLCNIFRIRIIRTAFSSCSCIFVKYQSFSKICTVSFFHNCWIIWIESCRYIGRKYFGITHRSANGKFTICSYKVHHFCYTVFKETGLHSGCSHTSNLFLIYKKTYACILRILYFKHCIKRRICADSVIMSIAHDHAAVKAVISGSTCRNHFDFC